MNNLKLIGQITTKPKLIGKLSYTSYELNKDYNRLANQPSIEGVKLINDKTFEDLGAVGLTNMEIENLINLQV